MDNLSREGILELSEDNPVGLIYSPTELHQYLVELIANHKTDYVHKGTDLASFSTLDDAMREARKRGAKSFFLCLDNTHDECGSECLQSYFNYLPVYPH
ncbi:hypothetical protein B1207_14200 [Legionella quinlivanii]|uniref:Uncharacterized protein n=1 Tax=Legionella quinlivanii TaxID=45073 RepID=A0A364LG03_9GAMM|nr:hypothetical protein [Legionella quinlivanii]RAP35047.1 hypothetical protein B1207_14200 [Legionella quinlivanii]